MTLEDRRFFELWRRGLIFFGVGYSSEVCVQPLIAPSPPVPRSGRGMREGQPQLGNTGEFESVALF